MKSDIIKKAKLKGETKMKKLLAILIALMMILSLCACSEEKVGEGEEETIEITPARGAVENGNFKNEAFGVSFEAGENWYFLTDEEIATAMGVAAEEMYGEGTEITGDHIYDLYCVKNETNATVSVNHENLGSISEFTDSNYYLETVMTQLLSSGVQNGVVDAIISEIEVSGITAPCLDIVLEYSGTTIYQKLIAKQSGDWMTTVTMASLDEAELSDLIAKLSFE